MRIHQTLCFLMAYTAPTSSRSCLPCSLVQLHPAIWRRPHGSVRGLVANRPGFGAVLLPDRTPEPHVLRNLDAQLDPYQVPGGFTAITQHAPKQWNRALIETLQRPFSFSQGQSDCLLCQSLG
jgi:hypothetical protein